MCACIWPSARVWVWVWVCMCAGGERLPRVVLLSGCFFGRAVHRRIVLLPLPSSLIFLRQFKVLDEAGGPGRARVSSTNLTAVSPLFLSPPPHFLVRSRFFQVAQQDCLLRIYLCSTHRHHCAEVPLEGGNIAARSRHILILRREEGEVYCARALCCGSYVDLGKIKTA